MQSLGHLTEFLEHISANQSSNVCNRFCTNEANNVASYQRYKIHRFSIGTCPLQVLSCLLQTTFQPYRSHRSMVDQTNEIIIVTNITMRMIIFLRNCFNRREYLLYFYIDRIWIVSTEFNHQTFFCKIKKTHFLSSIGVDWLFRRSRSSDESISAQVSYCYCHIVSCIIVLLHFCINSLMANQKIIGKSSEIIGFLTASYFEPYT